MIYEIFDFFRSNRVALDYNAAFQSAIAALKYLELNPPIVPTTPQPTTTPGNFSDATTESLQGEIDLENWFEGDDYFSDYGGGDVNTISSARTTSPPGLVGNIVNQPKEPEKLATTTATTSVAETTSALVTTDQPTTAVATSKPTTQTTLPQTTQPQTTISFTEMSTYDVINHTSYDATEQNYVGNVTSQTIETSSIAELTTAKRFVIRLPLQERLSYLEEIVYGEDENVSGSLVQRSSTLLLKREVSCSILGLDKPNTEPPPLRCFFGVVLFGR